MKNQKQEMGKEKGQPFQDIYEKQLLPGHRDVHHDVITIGSVDNFLYHVDGGNEWRSIGTFTVRYPPRGAKGKSLPWVFSFTPFTPNFIIRVRAELLR